MNYIKKLKLWIMIACLSILTASAGKKDDIKQFDEFFDFLSDNLEHTINVSNSKGAYNNYIQKCL